MSTQRGALARWLYLAAGVACTGLAAAGALLPVLPTTPFLLLATACFARSSPALHRRVLASPVFGPYLEQWQRERTIPRAAKRKAYALVVVAFAVSIALAGGLWPRIALAALGVVLLLFLRRLPTAPRTDARPGKPPGDRSRPPQGDAP